jgi:hypothetical protein
VKLFAEVLRLEHRPDLQFALRVPPTRSADGVISFRTSTRKDGGSMACNACETGFQSYQTIVPTIQRSGTTALLYVSNQGRNIVHIRRILLCYASPGGGSGTLYLRAAPDAISWIYPSTFLETGITALYYQLTNLTRGTIVQAQVEYIEIEGRSRSCPETM